MQTPITKRQKQHLQGMITMLKALPADQMAGGYPVFLYAVTEITGIEIDKLTRLGAHGVFDLVENLPVIENN
jgi:hypothetical protein